MWKEGIYFAELILPKRHTATDFSSHASSEIIEIVDDNDDVVEITGQLENLHSTSSTEQKPEPEQAAG